MYCKYEIKQGKLQWLEESPTIYSALADKLLRFYIIENKIADGVYQCKIILKTSRKRVTMEIKHG